MTPSVGSRALLAVALCLAGEAARAQERAGPPREWVPTVSFALNAFDERLRVRVDQNDYDSVRGQLRGVVALGFAHPVARPWGERVWLDGHASIGLGLAVDTGRWQVPLREDITFAFAATRWLTLRGGLGVGVTLDATGARRSFAEVGLPLSVTFLHAIELGYRPVLTLPLGSEESSALGGGRALSTRLTVLPFEVLLRVRVTGLGW